MKMDKCTRCAIEQGVNPLKSEGNCIWKEAGTVCPDYSQRPDMHSIMRGKVPKDETEILRQHMRLLAEKSRFRSANQLAEISDAMLKIHERLVKQKSIRFVIIQIFFGVSVCAFVALNKLFQRGR